MSDPQANTADASVNLSKKSLPSCDLCRRSKIKCNRQDPCFHCAKVGAECVYSVPAKLPRGRKGGRRKLENTLLDRIAKLEKLVENVGLASAAPTSSSHGQSSEDQRPDDNPKKSIGGMDRYLGSPIWLSLSEEISGMREVLDEPSDEEMEAEGPSPVSTSMSSPHSGISSRIMFPASMSSSRGMHQYQPSNSQLRYIYLKYAANVDLLVKILHGPSLRRYLLGDSEQLDCSPGKGGWDALKFAIYYATATSLTAEECLHNFGRGKADLISLFRSCTEDALCTADFLVTEDMSLLQALVLYLSATRSTENSKLVWTLTSVAVRIANGMGLHREKYGDKQAWTCQPFEREMRRRLWFQICTLDRQGANDRASDPIISTGSFTTELPLHVNDTDISPNDSSGARPRQGFTDMTLFRVTHEVLQTEGRLCHVPTVFGQFDSYSEDQWVQRSAWIMECHKHVEETYLKYCDATVPIQRYTRMVAELILALLWLSAYRPLHRHPTRPPAINVSHNVLFELAIGVLERNVQFSLVPEIEPYKWISATWVQWHALAVVLAELHVQVEGPVVERAWSVAETSFDYTAQYIADSDRGRLWRPMKKLMHKAQAVRRKHLEEVMLPSSNLQGQTARSHIDQFQFASEESISQSLGRVELDHAQQDLQTLGEPIQQIVQTFTTAAVMVPNWSQWGANEQFNSSTYNSELDQMAWDDWGLFVNDLQTQGDITFGFGDLP